MLHVLAACALAAPTPRLLSSDDGNPQKPVALPLLVPDGTRLKLQPAALEYLAALRGPVAVVAAIGQYRSGKSFLLNQLMRMSCDEGFKVGRDRTAPAGTERPVLVRMADYAEYARQQCGGSASCTADDSPLYVFDASFGERPGTRALAGEYAPPACFGRDVLELLGG